MTTPAWQRAFGVSLQKTLCSLAVAVAAFVLCSGSASLQGKQLFLSGADNYAFVSNHHVPGLCMFTVCIDLNRTQTTGGNWTAYSYDVSGNFVNGTHVELALSAENGSVKVYILGEEVELQSNLLPHRMHRVCCVWDGHKGLLEVFHDGDRMLNRMLQDLDRTCLRPGGTLVLGQLHKNLDGRVHLQSGRNFVGILHYFQMWDSVQEQQKLIECQPGNVVSWQGGYWSFHGARTEPAFHQPCGKVDPTPVAPLPTTKAPDSTAPEYAISTRNVPTAQVTSLTTEDFAEFYTTSLEEDLETAMSESSRTEITPTAHSDVVTSVLSSSLTTTTPKLSITPSDDGLSGTSSGMMPSHNPQGTISTPKTDGAPTNAIPTSTLATTMPYLNTLTPVRGTTPKSEETLPTSKPGGATQEIHPTSSRPAGTTPKPTWNWSDQTSQYGQTTPKCTWLTPMSKSTHISSTASHNGASQPSDVTAATTLINTKPVTGSKVTTTSINNQSAPPPSQSEPVLLVSDIFYNIQMNFSVSSKSSETFDYFDAVELSWNWLNTICNNSEFVVTNHNIRTNVEEKDASMEGRAIIPRGSRQKRARKAEEKLNSVSYSSKSIVKAVSNETRTVLKEKLQGLLLGPYEEENLSMTVDARDVAVSHFEPGTCTETSTKYKGTYQWPKTNPANTVNLNCTRNPDASARRTCLINIETRRAYWRRPNLTDCHLLRNFSKDILGLQNENITEENAEDMADHILTLLSLSNETLSKEQMQILVEKLADIADCNTIGQTLAKKTLRIINVIMTKAGNLQDLQPMVNSIFKIVEQIGFKVDFKDREFSIVLPHLALALLRPDRTSFRGIFFGVTSYNSKTDPEINIRQQAFEKDALASVSLPESLKKYLKIPSFQLEDHTEIQFNFFGTPELFEEKKGSSFKNAKLNSYVVGASIENVSVQNLMEPVVITLKHIEQNVNNSPVHCVFWDFGRNDNSSGWSSSGCAKNDTNANYTVCTCNHLTHFGVLLDLSREPINEADDRVLTLISYVGCGISCIFLGLALVVYLSIDKLCADYPSRILVNLCFALLMLNLTYLVNSWLASFHSPGLCIAVASALHYFLLAAFTWMGLEALHMYYALVKVFGTYTPNYMVKFSLAGWGMPAIVVAIVLIVGTDCYGTRFASRNSSSSTLFCWIQNDAVFYVSVVAYFCVVFLTNFAMFVTVFLQIQSMKGRHRAGPAESWHRGFLHDLKRVASLSCLLGLTWGFAFFAWGPVKVFFTYLFAVCNTLQGFFVFVFHCLMKENVRKQCQINFCCGRFRLGYSDGSGSITTLGYPSRNLKRKRSSHSLRSLKSCATTTTSNSSGGPPGASPNMSSSASGGVSCHTSCTPSICQGTRFPPVRRISLLDIELHQPHKMGLLS